FRSVYLEHGAHWAIGALALILLITVGDIHVHELVTGLIGIAFIGAAVFSSVRRNNKEDDPKPTAASEPTPVG
ncbi:MAG: DUF475 domain-containing protein, partial [Nocardia sp.]|nr:DUF475 domain-containing protein [Nocardia sp.]